MDRFGGEKGTVSKNTSEVDAPPMDARLASPPAWRNSSKVVFLYTFRYIRIWVERPGGTHGCRVRLGARGVCGAPALPCP